MLQSDFYKFARSEKNISPTTLDGYAKFSASRINPCILEERKLNAVSMDIFSRLQSDRILFLGTSIDDEVSNIIQAQLLYLASTDSGSDISMYINSPGGLCTAGLAILDCMELIKPDVSTICTGLAASMASILLCIGAKGKRYILPHSRVLIHQPLGGASGQASDILIAAKEISQMKKELISIIAEHTGQNIKKVTADCDRDYWMTAQDAVDYGMADTILKKTK